MAKSGPGIKPLNNHSGSPTVSTHNILLPEQELRRSEGCNFQCGVLPGRKKLVFYGNKRNWPCGEDLPRIPGQH